MVKSSKRGDIVAAAVALLAEGGSEALTASALAGRAGVSKANVFHHFPRLEDIVLEAFEAFIMGMPSMWPAPGMALRDWLLALGADTTGTVEADPALAGAYFGFVARARTDARLRNRLAEIIAAARAHFEAVLAELAPDRFPPAERRAMAELILITGDGLALHRQLFAEQADDQTSAWGRLVDMICPDDAP
ncbi:MAG: TetR family transcriptional regulator [Devosia sp.]|uniref:TetR/AcrR family transcriptional regulator n=1 Tax=Devosia sp. TaxID=1871048 RepID=UPI0024C870F3|nr:TetR/AcrR family transcriptional regulator [Devosia sp.]UYN98309.1 MAG: TetR family transcriptional regulator [Devosia sp.]